MHQGTFSFVFCAAKAPLRMVVKPETALVRPFVVCAVLRGVTFDPVRYNSFIDLQVGWALSCSGALAPRGRKCMGRGQPADPMQCSAHRRKMIESPRHLPGMRRESCTIGQSPEYFTTRLTFDGASIAPRLAESPSAPEGATSRGNC
jgi:hypothetical protein